MAKKVLLLILLGILSFTQLNIAKAADGETHTVTFIDFDEDVIEVQEVLNGQDAKQVNHTRIGYQLVGWSASILNITEDITVQAIYLPNMYDITFKNLDGSTIVVAEIGHDSVLEELNEQVRTAFNVGVIEYPATEDNIFEEENYQRLFISGDTIWHLVDTNQRQTITEYIVDLEGYEFTGWSPLENTVIKGDMDFNATFQEETDDNVVIDPEDPENEIIEFTPEDLTYVSADLLEASVTSEFLISLIDSLVNTLEESVLEFPELNSSGEDGVAVIIQKDALVYAEDNGIDLLIKAEGYELLIPNESLSRVLDSIITELKIEIKETEQVVRASYEVGDFVGTPYETIEIGLFGSLTAITDYHIEVTTDSTHEVVSLINGEYSLLETVAEGTGRKVILMNNGVVIKSILTEKEEPVDPVTPIPQEPRFDPIEWIKDLDKSVLALYAVGSYLVIYLAIYTIEFYRGKN